MQPHDLDAIVELYWQSRDAYNNSNPDHNHLRQALFRIAEILHREERMDNGLFDLECQILNP